MGAGVTTSGIRDERPQKSGKWDMRHKKSGKWDIENIINLGYKGQNHTFLIIIIQKLQNFPHEQARGTCLDFLRPI